MAESQVATTYLTYPRSSAEAVLQGTREGVIPKLGAVQPSEESGAECFTVLSSATLHAGSLAPLEKARGFGMTFRWWAK